MAETLTLPGFVNAHSHAFQRVLRGRTEGWTSGGWRESMLDLGPGLSPEQVRSAVQVYREMLSAGYTVVGEFHYLGCPRRTPRSRPLRRPGSRSCCCSAYGRGGLERFHQKSPAEYLRARGAAGGRRRVGLAPPVRACLRDWPEELGRYAAAESLPLHVHAATSSRARSRNAWRSTACGRIELLAEHRLFGPHSTVVHATTLTRTSSTCWRRADRVCVA